MIISSDLFEHIGICYRPNLLDTRVLAEFASIEWLQHLLNRKAAQPLEVKRPFSVA